MLVGNSKKIEILSKSALQDSLFKLLGYDVSVSGAGRTDAGVHAYGQVASFKLDKEIKSRCNKRWDESTLTT